MANPVKCSICGEAQPSLGQLRKHYKDAGHPTKKHAKETPPAAPVASVDEDIDDADEPEDDEGDVDAELALINECTVAFLNATTNRDQDFRVLEYLAQRFGPLAYHDEEQDAA